MKRKVCGLGALALVISATFGGTAFAGAKKTGKANLQGGNGDCGVDHPEDPVIGKISFKRAGGTVTLKVSLKHGNPNATYGVALYGNGCTGISSLSSTFVTNKKGVGKITGSVSVPGADTEFFADVYEEPAPGTSGPVSDTPYVTLAP